MRVALLHTQEALQPPVDPVIGQLEDTLRSLGHEVGRAEVADDLEALVRALREPPPELVINIAESYAGKSALESNVAGLLNLMHLRYTGSSPAGLLLAGDKSLTKKMLGFHDILTPEFATVYRGALDVAGDISFPVIVKPPQEDASIGISSHSVVHELKDLLQRISELQSAYQAPVLMEQYIEGREFYVGVLGNANAKALPLIEMDFSGFPADRPRIASWEAKWGDGAAGAGAEFAGTRSIFPTDVPEELAARMQRVSLEAFHALRLRDYARIDLRVTPSEEIYVIEVNPNCYLERDSEYARAAAKSGLEYPALIARIVELATARYSR